jgi:hypothetical protein
VRFHLEVPEDERGRAPEEAVVWVLTVARDSPAVSRHPKDALRALGLDATLLDVISERVLQPGEAETDRPVEAGDKLVVAGRRSQLESVGTVI